MSIRHAAWSCVSAGLVCCLAAVGRPQAGTGGIVHPVLQQILRTAAEGEQIEAYLVLQDQRTPESFEPEVARMSPRERRAFVVAELKRHAAATQAECRAALEAAVQRGQARILDILWMGNAILFAAEAGVITELAALPGIDRIRPIVKLPLDAYEDALAPAPEPAANPQPPVLSPPLPPLPARRAAAYPFFDDFESGAIGPHWSVQTTATGYAVASSANAPNGSFHVLMASSVDGTQSTASMSVTLDLTGQSDVGVRFQWKEFSDEDNANDGVFVSDNGGATFHKAHNLAGGSTTYATRAFSLDAVNATFGLSYTATYVVQFRWEDNFNIPTDGFAFDDIEIADGVGTPPPPAPTPNIVQLQAPMLWEIGFDGTGVMIGNIDSGVDWPHNDLVGNTFMNPGEIPGNGLDDDANGRIDDIVGWDFLNNNNDPNTSATHGTSTAGLMVGNGANGTITGMAIGGTMVCCEIGSEANYWSAQQYCMDLGCDVISSSHSYKWPFVPKPDYHMHRQMCDMELAAGVIHANSIGNQGDLLGSYPIPFNISAPGNCPGPWDHPAVVSGGRSSVMGCAGIHVADDSLYTSSGQGPAAWEDITLYDPAYPHAQNGAYFDYPYGGFGGGQPGLLKPEVVTYTDTVTSTVNGNGYTPFGGTSAATPQLGGAMVLLRQVQPEALPRHLNAAMELSAVDLGPVGKDSRYGSGKLQVFDAARRLVTLARAAPQNPALGETVTLDLFGEPGALLFGFVGGAIAANGTSFNLVPPLLFLGAFPLDGSGQGSIPLTVPNDSAFSGLVAQLQFGAAVQDILSWGGGPLFSVPESISVQ